MVDKKWSITESRNFATGWECLLSEFVGILIAKVFEEPRTLLFVSVLAGPFARYLIVRVRHSFISGRFLSCVSCGNFYYIF